MNAQDKAKFARQLYYARMGEVDKAFSEPSPESLQAWVIVVDTVEKMGNPKADDIAKVSKATGQVRGPINSPAE